MAFWLPEVKATPGASKDAQENRTQAVATFTAGWLAQLDGYQSVVREVEGSSPGRTNTQGLKN